MKRTALYQKHLDLGAKIVDFAGYEMPISYTSITEEHEYVRTKCGLFDVSHMGEFEIKGQEAEQYVDYLFTNDVTTMVDGQVLYGMMCYENGGVVDDLLVYKYNKHHYFLVVNASNIEKDFAWVEANNNFDATAVNVSEDYSEVALQGPYAEELLASIVGPSIQDLPFFHFSEMKIENRPFIVSRTGYTGEDGFELYGKDEDIVALWSLLLDKGGEQIAPVGLGARDTLRFEVALPLYGNELANDITPLEAGLAFAVKLDGGPFIGKDVLVRQKERKTKRRICGLTLLDKGIIRHGYPVFHMEEQVGIVTTGYKSPSTGETVALALINRPYDKLGTELTVDVRGKRKKVVVRSKKFYNKNYKK